MKNSLLKILKGDRVIWMVLLALTFFSLLIVYSATGALAYRYQGGNTFHYLIKQGGMIIAGFGVILFVTNVVSIKYLSIFSPIALFVAFVFLIVALVLNVGADGSGRTIVLKGVSFQPAELAKISLILFVSRLLANNQTSKNKPTLQTFLWILGITGAVCLTISIADFSTAGLLFLTIMFLMYIGRVPLKYLGLTVLAGLMIVTSIYFLSSHVDFGRFNTVKGRIDRFFNGDPNEEIGMTQAEYAEVAIYRGGRTGTGPGGSVVRTRMSAAYNDFIFAILVEEYGWFSFVVVFAFIVFASRAGIIIRKTSRTFPAFMVAGLATMIVLQAMINMGVSVGLLPVTGQPLPWVSMGGTSTLFTGFAIGCILRVSYQNKLDRLNQKPIIDDAEELPDEDHAFAEVGAIS